MKKTKFNALLCCILAIICSINFTACDKDKDGSITAIKGVWLLKTVTNYTNGQAENVNAPEIGNTTVIFDENTYLGKLYGSPLKEAGSWRIIGNTLEMKDDITVIKFSVSVHNNDLTISTSATDNGHNYKTEYKFTRIQIQQ